MTNNVNRCKFHVRILIGDVFGSVDPQKKTTYALGFVFILYRKIDSVILVQNAATADRETSIHAINWFISNCTPNEIQQDLMNVYVVFKIPNELLYFIRSFSDQLVYQRECDFELRANSESGVPVLVS